MVVPNCANRFWSSGVGVVMRRSRISPRSVVGSTMSALCSMAAVAKGLHGRELQAFAAEQVLESDPQGVAEEGLLL